MVYIWECIKAINPDAKFHISKESQKEGAIDLCDIEWLEDTTPISKEELKTKLTELQTEYDSQDYARKRKEEYPSIEEAVHAILDDDLENLQILRQAVKDKFPKENS